MVKTIFLVVWSGALWGQATLATFTLSEPAGVNWPNQPIEFRYDGGVPPLTTTRMLGPDGLTEVPYQWVSSCVDQTAIQGCIAIRDSLAANASNSYTLQSGVAPVAAPANSVRIASVPCFGTTCWQITNGLTGVRIVRSQGSPWNLAPIQGILLADGSTWTGAGASANLLFTESQAAAGGLGSTLHSAAVPCTGNHAPCLNSFNSYFIEAGPLKTVLAVNYTFNRPQYCYGPTCIQASGSGHYTAKFTLWANAKSIIVDEDSDMMFQYFVPIYAQVQPDTARYRAHDSRDGTNTFNPRCGYHTAVNITSATNSSPITLTFDAAIPMTPNWNAVVITGAAGNTAANSPSSPVTGPTSVYYLKGLGSPPYTSAQLYSDPGWSFPVAGNGTYTGGGVAKVAYLGQVYSDPVLDGFFDISYAADQPAQQNCTPGAGNPMLIDSYPSSGPSNGWSFLTFQSAGGNSTPVLGWYTGDVSTFWWTGPGPNMPGLYSSNSDFITSSRAADLQVQNLLRGPDGSIVGSGNSYSVHRNWGIFVSTKADVLAPASHQPINDDQNTLAGINLSRIYTYQLSFPDPTGGWTWLYQQAAGMNALMSLVRNGTSYCGSTTCYATLLNNASSGDGGVSAAITTMWTGNSQSAVQTALNTASTAYNSVAAEIANQDNRWTGRYGGYQLGLNWGFRYTPLLNAILMDSNSSASQKTAAKAQLAFYGNLIWDNYWWPLNSDGNNPTGGGCGTSNQCLQYPQYRANIALAIPTHPRMAANFNTALSWTVQDLTAAFNSNGTPQGSTHYQGTFTEPLYANYRLAQLNGLASFASPVWSGYANWELAIQTPPEPRFGSMRKGVSDGDGATEGDARTGLLATGLNGVNNSLAQNLSWAWNASNNSAALTHDNQFLDTWVEIDPTIPQTAPAASFWNLHVPGYLSALRYGFGTDHETALWFINGGYYSAGGHRHYDDGQVSLYAHSAPLAVDWNATLHTPDTYGRFSHNAVTRDAELTQSTHIWSTDTSLVDGAIYLSGANGTQNYATEFAAFTGSTKSCAKFFWSDGGTWLRCVSLVGLNPSYPLIYVSDTFAGANAAAPKTLTWNLMAEAGQRVTIPGGTFTPPTHFNTGCNAAGTPGLPTVASPGGGTPVALSNGLQRFTFTGAQWPQHSTNGINWDLWLNPSSGSAQYFIDEWGHGCHSTRETIEFATANSANPDGTTFNERQDILRVHDTGSFSTIIAPYRKTEAPTRSITTEACGTQIVQSSETTCFDDSHLTYTNGTKQVLTVYDASTQSAFGFTASGGAQELVYDGAGTIAWTIDDVNAGIRSVTLPPGTWYPNAPLQFSGGAYTYYHAGGAQPTPSTITFTQTPAPVRPVALRYTAPAGTAQVRVKFGWADHFAVLAPCPSACSVATQTPAGTWAEQHDFLDSNGNVIESSSELAVTVP